MGKKSFKRKINPNPEQADLYDKITFLQTKIIHKISKLKKNKPNLTLCDHFSESSTNSDQQYDPKINYYDEYWKEYLMTFSLLRRVTEFQDQVHKMQQSLQQIQKKFIERQNLLDLPALAKIKKSTSKLSQSKIESGEKQEDNLSHQNNFHMELKKQQQIEPHFIAFHHHSNQQNPIFQE